MKRFSVSFLIFTLFFVTFSSHNVHAEEERGTVTTNTTAKPESMRLNDSQKAELQRVLQERKDAMASREAQLRSLKDQWKTRREEVQAKLKADLQKIKDTRKQEIVENLGAGIGERNSKWVSHWNEVLKRLGGILDKVSTKAQEAATNGKDVSAVTAAVSSARTSLVSAQAKVDAQAAKTYTISVTTETNLGQNVKATLNLFHADVRAVVESINTARRSVEAALSALRTVLGEGNPTGTPTATTQP